MIFEKHLKLKYFIILLIKFIPFTVASDSDVIKKFFSFMTTNNGYKMNFYSEKTLDSNLKENPCYIDGIICNSLDQITGM